METLTNDINDLCFIDTETRALEGLGNEAWGSVKTTSTGRYARSSKVIIVTYAIGDGEVKKWYLTDFSKTLCWRDAPPDLCAHIKRVYEGKAWFVAFNSGFDIATLNRGIVKDRKSDVIETHHMLDCMARATQSNLPPSLDGASQWVGHDGKQEDGKSLISLFCVAGGATPQSHPEQWERFLSYAAMDIDTMRTVWKSTMDLSDVGWEEFWASENINARGMPVDVEYVTKAAKLAEDYKQDVRRRIEEITDGELFSPHQHGAIAQWVYDRVEEIPDGQDALVKRYDEETEGGELLPAKLGCDRHRTARLIALLERHNEEYGLSDDEHAVLQLLRVKEYGASATIGKFAKMRDAVMADGRLPNQYTFGGASQTGRFSSRGVQMHNLTRQTIEDESGALNDILDGINLATFEDRYGDPGLALSRLVRPAIAAPEGRTLVWGDWSNIEARVLPWLADCEARLGVFRRVDADPAMPDVYTVSAAGMDALDLPALWRGVKAKEGWAKEARQKGKISELSLGFGGASGALISMATNYGMAFTEKEAKEIVTKWRAANAWAQEFWDEVWTAFTSARSHPGTAFPAGRVTYLGVEGYLGDISVFCFLPDGRPLIYRDVRWERRTITDSKTGEEVEKEQFTFGRGFGRIGLWYGILAENITQATAASVLRRSLAELEFDLLPETTARVVAHTHDEIVIECDDTPAAVKEAKAALLDSMTYVPEWAEGLPLAADISDNFYYTKKEE